MTAPALFLTHGGGPMPLLGQQEGIARHIKQVAATMQKPKAVLVVSGHWEESRPTVTTSAKPPMLYDYYGFPAEAYKIDFPAPGDPAIAARVNTLLRDAGFEPREDPERGYDHGVFVPLKLLFPDAGVPVVVLSLLDSMDAAAHLRMGRALAPLREEGVMIVGSGGSFHSLPAMRKAGFRDTVTKRNENPQAKVLNVHQAVWQILHFKDFSRRAVHKEWDEWLSHTITSAEVSPSEREAALLNWKSAPSALFCHPREEHLLPLFVAAAAAGGAPGRVIWNEVVVGFRCSSYQWD